MKTYLISVVGMVLLGGIIVSVLPNGKMQSTVKTVVKLTVLLVVLSPFVGWINNFTENSLELGTFSKITVIESDETFINYFCEKKIADVKEEIESGIKTLIGKEIELNLAVDKATQQVQGVLILTLLSESEKQTIREYIKKNYGYSVGFEDD